MKKPTSILVTMPELMALRRMIDADRKAERYGEDEEIQARILRRLVLAKIRDGARVQTRPGKCVVCRCTHDDPCCPPCSWANDAATLCTACADA